MSIGRIGVFRLHPFLGHHFLGSFFFASYSFSLLFFLDLSALHCNSLWMGVLPVVSACRQGVGSGTFGSTLLSCCTSQGVGVWLGLGFSIPRGLFHHSRVHQCC